MVYPGWCGTGRVQQGGVYPGVLPCPEYYLLLSLGWSFLVKAAKVVKVAKVEKVTKVLKVVIPGCQLLDHLLTLFAIFQ